MAKLQKLGFVLSERTVARYLRRIQRRGDPAKKWLAAAYKRYEGSNPDSVRVKRRRECVVYGSQSEAYANDYRRQIDKVRQEGSTLHLDFTDGSTVQIMLAVPTSSVMVRDRDGKLEYTD